MVFRHAGGAGAPAAPPGMAAGVSLHPAGPVREPRGAAGRARVGGGHMRKQVEERTVREVMTPTPVAVRPSTTVGELKALFEAHDFNAFPVVDEAGALCGMVSKLDFLRMFRPARRRWLPDLRAVWAERVGDIMSAGLIAVEPGGPVVGAVDLMVGS